MPIQRLPIVVPIGIYAPPPYPDLCAYQIYVNVNHSLRRICVGAVVRNLGGAPPERSWQVAIGITYIKQGVTISTQEIFTIPQNQIIGPDGFETPCSEGELIYRDEDSGAVYTLEALVDVAQELIDLDRGNNYSQVTTWWVNPATAAKYRRVKLDMTDASPRVIESEDAGS